MGFGHARWLVVQQPVALVPQPLLSLELLITQVLQTGQVTLDLLRGEASLAGFEEVGVVVVRSLGVAPVPLVAGSRNRNIVK